MRRTWRAVILLVLLVGPILAYMGFGAYWLVQRGWAIPAFAIWVAAGIVFGFLANRWTKNQREILPPIDWDAPETFGTHDKLAWDLVEREANRSDAIDMESLSGFDIYIDTGRSLASRLAAHYHPLSTNTIEHVPVVEILTALELAAEDLSRLCRQFPGGDLVTYAHWKKAVAASGLLSKANEIYGYLLPVFQPFTGLVRLGTQKLMVQPAWKNMQQNVLRWFFRAYVNRLGTHLIELYSGRLAIGADGYRKLRRRIGGQTSSIDEPGPLVIAVAGARDAGKSSLIAALRYATEHDLSIVKARLEQGGFDEDLADRLEQAEWMESPGYTASVEGESARDRSTRRDAVEKAVEADMLLLIVDGSRDNHDADLAFLKAWEDWYVEQKQAGRPPALLLVSKLEKSSVPTGANATNGLIARSDRSKAVVSGLRQAFSTTIAEVLPIELEHPPYQGIADLVLPALAALLHRADKASVIRHLRRLSTRSKARRVLSQVGKHGRSLWESVRRRKRATS
jgi:uncharacterized protein